LYCCYRGLRPRNRTGNIETHLRAVLYEQKQGYGNGVVDLPLYCRGSWRAAIGRFGPAAWCDLLNLAAVAAGSAMSGDDSIVYIVDDDPSMREALTRLLGTVGLRAEAFKTPQEFLHAKRSDAPSCLVLDVRLPGLSGLDLQRELANTDPPIQIVFITAHGDIPMTVQALKAGAVDFLTKPFGAQQLFAAVGQAINGARVVRTNRRRAARCCARRIHARRTPPGRALVRRWRRGVLHLLAIKKRERNGSH